jgi:hypothetical protein
VKPDYTLVDGDEVKSLSGEPTEDTLSDTEEDEEQ